MVTPFQKEKFQLSLNQNYLSSSISFDYFDHNGYPFLLFKIDFVGICKQKQQQTLKTLDCS